MKRPFTNMTKYRYRTTIAQVGLSEKMIWDESTFFSDNPYGADGKTIRQRAAHSTVTGKPENGLLILADLTADYFVEKMIALSPDIYAEDYQIEQPNKVLIRFDQGPTSYYFEITAERLA